MGAVQGLFFALLLLTLRHGRVAANRILAVFLFLASIGFLSVSGLLIFKTLSIIPIFRLCMLTTLCLLPLLYFYVNTLVNKRFRFSNRHLLHFIPVLAIVLAVVIKSAPSFDLSTYFAQPSYNHLRAVRSLWILYAVPYVVSIFLLLKSHDLHIRTALSRDETLEESRLYLYSVHVWVRTLLVACCLYWVTSLVTLFFRRIPAIDAAVALVSTGMIYLLGFLGMRTPLLFFQTETFSENADSSTTHN
jgi:hypothetical protein